MIVLVATSLDGFIARADGSFDFLFQDGDYGMSAFLRTIDTVLMGRATYDVALRHGFPPSGKVKHYVFAHRATSIREDVEIVAGDAAAFVRELRARPGKDIWVLGGGDLTAQLLDGGEVDELSLAIHPVALGRGIPLFQQKEDAWFDLLETKAWPNGLLQVRYAVRRR